jgi:hypothetical protein
VKPEEKPEEKVGGWKTEINGYFRAPMALGISQRRDVQDGKELTEGPKRLQLAYGPNRVIDSSYYSFAYTTMQELDWAELFIHSKKKHVDAVIGWMGYWFGAAGYRNYDASWAPGMAYLTLDTDLDLGSIKPNLAFTVGAFWPQFGYHQKYDTFTLGRFRMLGEQMKLTIPINEDLTLKLYEGFGTNRDGAFSFQQNNPLYAGKTGVDLISFGHIQVSYGKMLDIGLHYNYTFTRDPNLTAQAGVSDGKTFTNARDAKLAVAGAEIDVRLPYAGRLWLSPSYITVRNGWALAGAGGTEVMHAQNGMGLAENYLAWTNTYAHSTGSGTMANVGFIYENSLSNILPDSGLPEFKLSIFGLMSKIAMDLPKFEEGKSPRQVISQKGLTQLKYGADLTAYIQSWMSAMVRWDTVLYNMNPQIRTADLAASWTDGDVNALKNSEDYKRVASTGGYIFSSLSARLSFFTHMLSGECIYLQFTRYIYGDKMVLAGTWPWDTPLVAGTDVIQGNGGYSKKKPDANVIRLQAQVRF